MTAIAVTIAGSDSGGGAGIQADLKTFSALGVYGASVITALTAQNTLAVTGIHNPPADFITAQMDAVYADLAVNATKIGMLSVPETIEAVAEGLKRHETGPIVLDPVMVAASGDPLLADTAVALLVERLLPASTIITPNLHEAAHILKTDPAESRGDMLDQAQKLIDLGAQSVLLKGGHGSGAESTDLFLTADGAQWLEAPRHETQNTHGTGCTLSSAIAANLSKGKPLSAAVEDAKKYITDAIRAADRLKIGAGHGPVHHFHAVWGDGQ